MLLAFKVKFLFFCALAALASRVVAWGSAGHETVCEIAYQELNDDAREVVTRLLSQETSSDYPTFPIACTWPDSSDDLTKSRRPEHFINLSRSWYYIQEPQCDDSDTCLFTAIPKDQAVLLNAAASDGDKWTALKFFGHWLGDIHQPLHVAYQDDRGGNEVDISSNMVCMQSLNLHSVWDTCSVEHLMSTMGFDSGDTRQRVGFGQALHAAITDSQRESWLRASDPLHWASESYSVTRLPAVLYCVQVDKVCQYSSTQVVLDANGNKKTLDLSQQYLDGFEEEIAMRLKQGGVRLGAILNAMLSENNK